VRNARRVIRPVRVEETTLDEVQISKVAAILAEWNPLGFRADSVSDLDGYRIEAIDIIMALGVWRFVAPEKTVSDILNQAFGLSLKPLDCVVPGACEEDPTYPWK
jgi:hypothetical protein